MIEIERKLHPSSEIVEKIKNDATFLVSQMMNDIVYDYEDLSLIQNDIWLRKRNGKFDLKVSKDNDIKNRKFDIYDEIEEESKMCEFLKIKSIESANFIEIAHLVTRREKYKLEEFNIDFDWVTSAHDDFIYHIMEVELILKNESEIVLSTEKIKEFMCKYGIEDKPAIAKITQYFYEKKRHIYDVLM